MRRLVALLAALALLASPACGDGPGPAPDDLPAELPDAAATAGLDTIGVRRAVAEFLDAYAESGEGVERLQEIVVGPELEDWAHWVGVQNAAFEEELEGRAIVRESNVLAIDDEFARASVDASVAFRLGEGGDRFLFQGLVDLRRRDDDPLRWSVLNATRDGRSMTEAITVFDPAPVATSDVLRLEAVSVFRFAAVTVVNVRVRNRAAEALPVDVAHAILQVGGRFLGATNATRTLMRPVRSGEVVEGGLHFPPMPLSAVPQAVLLGLGPDVGQEDLVAVELPAEAFEDDVVRDL